MFTLKINTMNDAFGESPEAEAAEIARIISCRGGLLRKLLTGDTEGKLYDANGNDCGSWTWTPGLDD